MKKKIFAIVLACVTALSLSVCAFATESGGVQEMITGVTGALGEFSVANLVLVIAAGLGIAVPLILAWFAFRWIFKKAKGALKSGK